jgi:hypothetical protein
LSTMAQQARPGFWPGFTGPGPGRAGRPVWPSLLQSICSGSGSANLHAPPSIYACRCLQASKLLLLPETPAIPPACRFARNKHQTAGILSIPIHACTAEVVRLRPHCCSCHRPICPTNLRSTLLPFTASARTWTCAGRCCHANKSVI